MTSPRRGEIIDVNFPFVDLQQVKRRPALVVQSDKIQTGLPQVIVACISGNLARTGSTRITVRLSDPLAKGTNLKSDSVIMMDKLATIDLRAIHKIRGEFTAMNLIDDALRHSLDL